MVARDNNSIVENNKNIKLSGEARGIIVTNGGKGINNKDINLSSQEVKAEGYAKGYTQNDNFDWKYKETGIMYSKLTGMSAHNQGIIINNKTGIINLDGSGIGMNVNKNSKGENKGKINLNAGIEKWSGSSSLDDENSNGNPELKYENYARIVGMKANNSEIINSGNINILNNGIGMIGDNQSNIINNEVINIEGKGKGEPSFAKNVAIYIFNNSKGENKGTIKVTGNTENEAVVLDESSSFINNGEIEVSSIGVNVIGISGNGTVGGTKLVNNGNIIASYSKKEGSNYSGDVTGISAVRDIFNNGLIEIKSNGSRVAVGIESNNNYSQNNIREINNGKRGKIVVNGDNGIGIQATQDINNQDIIEDKISIVNDGLIIVKGTTKKTSNASNVNGEILTGIQAFNKRNQVEKGLITNNNKIEIESLEEARGIDSYGNDVINNGVINVKGLNAKGIMISGKGAIATNKGTINVDGKGSFGMYAGTNSTAINSETGIINVSATAEGGMIASGEGSKVINKGTINIANRDGLNESNKNSIALKSSSGGVIENYGTIKIDGNLTLSSMNNGKYVIGTNTNGTYGKISAKNVSIDGDVIVSSEITKNEYKNEYVMQNVIDAEKISVGDKFKITSNSLLYDAKPIKDTWGNLDVSLNRNNKILSDFTTGYIKETADIFGKYQNEKELKKLSLDAQEVIKSIDTSNVNSINESLKKLTPTIYSNIGRQVLDTSEAFKEQDLLAINNLKENKYNFTFIGEYQDINPRKDIEGYKSKLSGFVGAINFDNGLYGTLGYGYNNIDYENNGKGDIQTIHIGLNKFIKYEGMNLKLGLGGEYNFHKNQRDIDILSKQAKSNFNSYGISTSGEISKVFGNRTTIEPYLGLDLTYMKYNKFSESGADSLDINMDSENYTSILPKSGILLNSKYDNLSLFMNIEYGHELGSIDKNQRFSYKGFDGKGRLPKDKLETGITKLKIGTNYKIKDVTLGLSIGENLGKRNNKFGNISLSYIF